VFYVRIDALIRWKGAGVTLDDVAGDIDDVEATRGAANKLDDIDEWARKGLIDNESEYEWFRQGLRGGAIGGASGGGLIILFLFFLLFSFCNNLGEVLGLFADLQIGVTAAVTAVVLILTGGVGGGVVGAVACRLAKGNSGWYGSLSILAGFAGGIAGIIFFAVCISEIKSIILF
jgi:hypothetical protein